jgi:hypothetical protein
VGDEGDEVVVGGFPAEGLANLLYPGHKRRRATLHHSTRRRHHKFLTPAVIEGKLLSFII